MLPTLRQRLFIAVAFVAGLVILLLIRGPLMPADGSSGITLLDARVGLVPAVALAVLASVPVVLLGLLVGCLGHPLSGVLVYAAGLTVLAGRGGGSIGFLWRSSGTGDYLWLVVDLVVWFGLLGLLVYLLATLRPTVRGRLRDFASPSWEAAWMIGRGNGLASLSGGLATAVIAALLTHLLLQRADTGQIIGGLMLAFALAGMIGKLVVPQMSPTAALLSPVVVALGGYVWVWFTLSPGTQAQLEGAWYDGTISGVARALPIHYASAAVTGLCLGLGMGQGMISSDMRAEEERLATTQSPPAWLTPFSQRPVDETDAGASE
jgi:hypothetical protein